MSIGISVTLSDLSKVFGGDLHAVQEAARVADAVGIDQIAVADHLAIGPHTDRYPYGDFPYPLDEPWPEPLTSLAGMAAVTSRVRLATGILIAPLRPALLLAKTLATLDVLSRGRIDIGVGTGWHVDEFDAAGVPFAGRGSRLDDTLRACRVLWRDAPASFESDTVSFRDITCLPHPVQKDGVPIWFGGRASERNAARIAEFGVGWMPGEGGFSREVEDGVRTLRTALEAAGRDPRELRVRAGVKRVRAKSGEVDLDAVLAQLPELAERGITLAAFGLRGFVRSTDEIRPFLERLGAGS